LLILYLLILVWLVLFKLTFNVASFIHHEHRSLNLVPFAAPSIVNGKINYGEMIMNCVFFVPFGLLLSAAFKRPGFWRKLAFIVGFSVAAESIQYIFAIGATDITDIITNTVGGLLGLLLYDFSNRFIASEKLDGVIISLGIVLLVLFISVRGSHYFNRMPRTRPGRVALLNEYLKKV